MLARDFRLSWAEYRKINISDIKSNTARIFIRELTHNPRQIIVDAYLCSDARNHYIRQILTQIPYVNVLNTAGNMVYLPHERPSIVIAHGNSKRRGCGAIDHVRSHGKTGDLGYPFILELEADPIRNAKIQLTKINPEWRGGIIYFNHELGTVELIEGEYNKYGIGLALFSELKKSLKDGFTNDELMQMTVGQNPEVIFLSNIQTDLTAFDFFTINLQRAGFHGIIHDSLKYGMEHSLRGEGSFKDTRIAVMAFLRDEAIPNEFQTLFEKEPFVRNFLDRGGEIYVVTVGDLPSIKAVYSIITNP
jgi:hypothetical protein